MTTRNDGRNSGGRPQTHGTDLLKRTVKVLGRRYIDRRTIVGKVWPHRGLSCSPTWAASRPSRRKSWRWWKRP